MILWIDTISSVYFHNDFYIISFLKCTCQGWIQDFKLGGGALKKNWPNGGVFRVKKHDFTPKNHILSNCGGRREQIWGISCEKSRFYAKKAYFSQF